MNKTISLLITLLKLIICIVVFLKCNLYGVSLVFSDENASLLISQINETKKSESIPMATDQSAKRDLLLKYILVNQNGLKANMKFDGIITLCAGGVWLLNRRRVSKRGGSE